MYILTQRSASIQRVRILAAATGAARSKRVKPYFDDGHGIQIFLGDCREILPTLPKVDLVLTDPPYGIGARMQGGTWATRGGIYDAMQDWDLKPVDNATLAMVIDWGKQAIIWGGNYYSLPPMRCWLAWMKIDNMGPNGTMADFELAWTNIDFVSKSFNEIRNPDGKRCHPTQKPISLMKWCLNFRGEPQTILDPFCGSGSSLVAAKLQGKKGIGIEISEHYAELAANRLRQSVLNFEG